MNNSAIDNFETTSKLNLVQHQSSSSSQSSNLKRNKIIIKVFFSLIIVLALITGAMIIDLIQKYNKSHQKLKLDQQNESLQVFCSMTRHPDSCFTPIILLANPYSINSPDDIFNASFQIAIKEVTNLTALTRALILKSTTESRNESALLKCSSLIDDSLNQLNRSLTTSRELPLFAQVDSEMEMLVREKIRDVKPWVNDALFDLSNCFGILGKEQLTAVIELRHGVHKAMMYVSNIYDFLEGRDGIIEQLHFQVQEINGGDDLEYLTTLFVFCPQYFVLIFMLCLLLRIY